MSKSIVLYLHMHQPYRLKTYTIFDAAHDHHYFNDNSKSDLNNESQKYQRVLQLPICI